MSRTESSTTTRCCQRCESPLELSDLRCAVCGFASAELDGGQEAAISEILRCRGCGASMAFSAEAQGLQCGFCGSVLELEENRDPREAVELWIPLEVDEKDARRALLRWLRKAGFWRPSDLARMARVEKIRLVYFVAWAFDANARISWTADSNAGAGRSSWAPHAGQTTLDFDDVLCSASRGLEHSETEALFPSYTLSASVSLRPEIEEALFEEYDVQRSGARARIFAAIEELAKREVERNEIPGSSFRNVHVEAMLEGLVTRRISAPAYILSYRYRGSFYRVVISGEDARTIHGSMPVSVEKILLAIVVVLAIVALSLMIASTF